jgi:predicted AlkP superfamily pyrophosphatase or phosphodiesterase
MRKQIFIQIIILIVAAAASSAAPLTNVIIISIDALHPAALGAEATPTIHKEMTDGTYTLDGYSTNPPKTLISHTAMFTGLPPAESGKLDNQWQPGEPTINRQTIFDVAKHYNYQTGFFYSKQKLGFLVNNAVDVHRWSREDAIDLTEAFVRKPGRNFVFLHVSGLDFAGPEYGWLSAEYMEELSYIDEYLTPLIRLMKQQKNYLIIITSDHGGHGKVHGSQHPDDYKLPLITNSDVMKLKNIQNNRYSVTELKDILDRALK